MVYAVLCGLEKLYIFAHLWIFRGARASFGDG